MVPAFAVGLAVLWAAKQPKWSGAMIGFGASLKLWPALLIAPMVGRGEPAKRRMAGFALTGVLLALFSLIAGGPTRLISPLTWQDDRGLQIESVPATFVMLRAMTHGGYHIALSTYNAYEITGRGAGVATSASTLLMALAIVHAAALGLVAYRRKNLPGDWLGLAVIAVIATMLVANKTFSPQYVVWFGAPVSAWFVLRHRSRDWAAWTLVAATIALAALTQAEYPMHYASVIHAEAPGVLLLFARNMLMILIALATVTWAWIDLLWPAARRSPNVAPSRALTEFDPDEFDDAEFDAEFDGEAFEDADDLDDDALAVPSFGDVPRAPSRILDLETPRQGVDTHDVTGQTARLRSTPPRD
jgi:hypothetical protein